MPASSKAPQTPRSVPNFRGPPPTPVSRTTPSRNLLPVQGEPPSLPNAVELVGGGPPQQGHPSRLRRLFPRNVVMAMRFAGRLRMDVELRASQMLVHQDPSPAPPQPANDDSRPIDPMQIWIIRFRPEWVVDPAGNRYYFWLAFLSLAVVYNTIMVAPRTVFHELEEGGYSALFYALDYIGDVSYLVDIVVHMFTGYLEEGVLVTEPRKLIKAYVRTKASKLDMLSVFPTDIALLFTGIKAPYPAVRINRLLKYGRLSEFFARLESRTNYPDFFRMVVLVATFVLMMHLNACLFYMISDSVGLNSDGWVYPGDASWRKPPGNGTNEDDSLYTKYVWCFYWALQTLTLIGQIRQPDYEGEFLFVTVNFLVGVIVYANIVGNVSRTIANMTNLMETFRQRMDAVKQYMILRKIEGDLQERVMRYFEYQWTNEQFIDESKALACLPDKLEAELAMRVHLETLKRVGIFQDAEPGLLADLVLKLKLEIYSPGDYICRKGDIGKEMYIVKRGRLEVVADDGKTVFATLSEGIKTGNRRTANVRSVGYSDLFCLSKEALWDALAEYPEGKKQMLERGKQMLLKDSLLDEKMATNAEMRQSALIDKVERLERNVDELQTRFGRLVAEQGSSLHKMRLRTSKLRHMVHVRLHYASAPEPINS